MTPTITRFDETLRLRKYANDTRRTYRNCVDLFLRTVYPRTVECLSVDDVRTFLLGLEKLGRSTSTLRVYLAALICFFHYDLGRPGSLDSIPRARGGRKPPRAALTLDEVTAMLDASAGKPLQYTLVALMVGSGLRISEVAALQIGDIDSDAGLLHVRHGKGDKARSVPLGDRLLRVLRRYWRVAQPGHVWLFPSRLQSRYRDDRHHPMSVCFIRRVVKRAARDADLSRTVLPHDLRRTYATLLLEAGVDGLVVQSLLGHAHADTTRRYAQVRTGLLRRTPTPLDLASAR